MFPYDPPPTPRARPERANSLEQVVDRHGRPIDPLSAVALAAIYSRKSFARPEAFAESRLGEYTASNPAIVKLASLGYVTINKAKQIAVSDHGRWVYERLPWEYSTLCLFRVVAEGHNEGAADHYKGLSSAERNAVELSKVVDSKVAWVTHVGTGERLAEFRDGVKI